MEGFWRFAPGVESAFEVTFSYIKQTFPNVGTARCVEAFSSTTWRRANFDVIIMNQEDRGAFERCAEGYQDRGDRWLGG
jgi:hypothetical protein